MILRKCKNGNQADEIPAKRLIITDIDGTILRHDRRVEQVLQDSSWMSFSAREIETGKWKYLTDKAKQKRFLQFFFSKRYFNERVLQLDKPAPKAAEVLQDLRRKGLGIIYLTGRYDSPDGSVKHSTKYWLVKHGFPSPDELDVQLIMKPSLEMDDQEFKDFVLGRIVKRGQVLVGIGDQPGDALAYAHHGILPILISSWLHPKEELQHLVKGIQVVQDWAKLRQLLLDLLQPQREHEFKKPNRATD